MFRGSAISEGSGNTSWCFRTWLKEPGTRVWNQQQLLLPSLLFSWILLLRSILFVFRADSWEKGPKSPLDTHLGIDLNRGSSGKHVSHFAFGSSRRWEIKSVFCPLASFYHLLCIQTQLMTLCCDIKTRSLCCPESVCCPVWLIARLDIKRHTVQSYNKRQPDNG